MKPIAVFGISGRMGQALIRALQESSSPVFALSGAIASPASARLGQDAAATGAPTGVLITGDAALGVRGARVAVDFSVASCVAAHAAVCAAAGVPLLIGATGLDAAGRALDCGRCPTRRRLLPHDPRGHSRAQPGIRLVIGEVRLALLEERAHALLDVLGGEGQRQHRNRKNCQHLPHPGKLGALPNRWMPAAGPAPATPTFRA